MKLTRRTTLLSGLALLGLANAAALAAAAYNRSGEPESTLVLTERELRPPYEWTGRNEDSGLALSLQWRVLRTDRPNAGADRTPFDGGGIPAWLDRSKMASLGFDVDPSGERRGMDRDSAYRRQLPREVFLVLELDGSAYRAALEHAASAAKESEAKNERGDGKKTAADTMDRETRLSSRLFAVDAGLDLAALRSSYPDRARYAIVRGQVAPVGFPVGKGAAGVIADLSAGSVNVPLEMRAAFEAVAPNSDMAPGRKRFVAKVAFGQRLEPWLVSAEAQ